MAPVSDVGSEAVDVAIVGAGVQGLGTARRLSDEGLRVVVLERQQDLGGVWNSFANTSSRVQVNETYYRLGYQPAEEDYTQRANVLREMRMAAEAAGVLQHLCLGVEVHRVRDSGAGAPVSVFWRPSPKPDELGAAPRVAEEDGEPLQELLAREVIFCTGGLQQPRRVELKGEAAFEGPIVYGVNSHVEELNSRGKRVAIIGMGAFGIENARTALLAGASHVDLIAKRKNVVMTRFTAALGTTADNDLVRGKDRKAAVPVRTTQEEQESKQQEQPKQQKGPVMTNMMNMMLSMPYTACNAQYAMPELWKKALAAGRSVAGADSPNTVPTISDVFFIGHALGRLRVHTGTVDRLEAGTVVLTGGQRVPADILVKNLGFESPEAGNLMGSVCEVEGWQTYQPPLWITPRVLVFRSEHAPLEPEAWRHADEMHNLPASVPFFNAMWLEIYLYFRQRPQELHAMLEVLPRVELSRASMLEACRGLHMILQSSDELRKKVVARRRWMNDEAFKRYSPPKTPKMMRRMVWLGGFLQQNRADWEDTCHQLTGDPKAVPFIWEGAANMFGTRSRRPEGQAAL